MIKFTVLGQPQGKARAKVTMRGSYAHAYTPQKTAMYENLIKLSYIEKFKGEQAYDVPLAMDITAYYQIPKSFSKVKKSKAKIGDIRPQVKPDIDNIAKVVCDALNGVAYLDDKQIVDLSISKHYAETPRVEIEITEVNYE